MAIGNHLNHLSLLTSGSNHWQIGRNEDRGWLRIGEIIGN